MASLKNLLKKYLPEPIVNFCWLIKKTRILFQFIRWIPRYNEDSLITTHYPTFMTDDKFVACYNSAVKEILLFDPALRWRVHTIVWAANRGKNLEGDFVECGVNWGFFSKIAMDYIDFKDLPKTFFLLDTYEGLVEKYLTENEKKAGKKAGGYEPCYEKALNTFKDYKNVKIIKGPVPETLPKVTSKKIAYLSIDMNCVIPEIAAAEYFWDKLVSGAVIILDDYGHPGFEEQKYGFDKFAKEKKVDILCSPTGQGLIFKP
jgi:hypothetical protein